MNHDHLQQKIKSMYGELGYTDGWRFLYSSRKTLAPATTTVLLGLNPGGTGESVTEDQRIKYSCESGSAYTSEIWAGVSPAGTSPLQRQIGLLCEAIEVDIEQVLAGNLVPFRSKNWAKLREKKASLRFGINLWSLVLETVQPDRVFAFGTTQRKLFASALGISSSLETASVNWGNQKAYLGRSGSTTLAVLPHFSRYKLFGRKHGKSKPFTDWIGSL